MNSIAGQYSNVLLYSLYQASPNGSASSQSNSSSASGPNNSGSNQAPSDVPSVGTAQASGNIFSEPSASASLQGGLTSEADAADSNSPASTTATESDNDSDDSSGTNPSGPFTNNTQANADYQSMVLNLGSGNLAAAAKDYSQLQTDLKLHSHHHSAALASVDTNPTSDGTSGNVFSVTV